MSFTKTIKDYILGSCRMDSVGVAPVSAFAGEPEGHRPEDILPGAKSVVVFTRRIPDGTIQAAFRSREDGNLDAHSAYAAYGSDLTPNMNVFFMQFNIATFIETTFGYTAVPVPSGPMQNVTPVNVPLPIFVGPKKNVYIVNPERAAYAAGLGDLAWNNMLVTRENGPRQVVGLVLTSMELDYDQPYDGPRLCDPEACGICSKLCPMHAIPGADGEADVVEVAGRQVRMAHINTNACAVASMAFRNEFAVKAPVPDLIQGDAPTDEELAEAYAKKPISHYSLDHYPKHFCNKCMLYCPLGRWKERFFDTGLSKFDGGELAQ